MTAEKSKKLLQAQLERDRAERVQLYQQLRLLCESERECAQWRAALTERMQALDTRIDHAAAALRAR